MARKIACAAILESVRLVWVAFVLKFRIRDVSYHGDAICNTVLRTLEFKHLSCPQMRMKPLTFL
ncbi:hypothetical protein E2C01_001008 [Portunus trituberculatus]|uniref:Secreted protein n=1 Tax=Portunus trituberculatus TaxID=210409 RepID=A0A5B7CI59_PORTR|nr:hypothetical protein [Portunus trituberculatus]